MTVVILRRAETHRHTGRRQPCDDRGYRERSSLNTSSHNRLVIWLHSSHCGVFLCSWSTFVPLSSSTVFSHCKSHGCKREGLPSCNCIYVHVPTTYTYVNLRNDQRAGKNDSFYTSIWLRTPIIPHTDVTRSYTENVQEPYSSNQVFKKPNFHSVFWHFLKEWVSSWLSLSLSFFRNAYFKQLVQNLNERRWNLLFI